MDLNTRINLFGIAVCATGFILGRIHQWAVTKEKYEMLEHELVQCREYIDEMLTAYWNGTNNGEKF